MSTDIQRVKAGERAKINHPRGRGFELKNETDETDIRLFFEEKEDDFPVLGSEPPPPKLMEVNKVVYGPAPRKVTPNPGPNHKDGKRGDKKGRDISQLKPGDDLLVLTSGGQNDSQGPGEDRSLETKDPRNSGGRQRVGDYRRPPGQQHPNGRDQTDKNGHRNKLVNLKDAQHPGGRPTRGRGPGPGTGPDRRPRRTSSGTIPEGGGVYVEDPPQTTGHNAARDETGAGPRRPDRRGPRV